MIIKQAGFARPKNTPAKQAKSKIANTERSISLYYTPQTIGIKVNITSLTDGQNTVDQIAFCALHSDECWLHTCDACVITT